MRWLNLFYLYGPKLFYLAILMENVSLTKKRMGLSYFYVIFLVIYSGIASVNIIDVRRGITYKWEFKIKIESYWGFGLFDINYMELLLLWLIAFYSKTKIEIINKSARECVTSWDFHAAGVKWVLTLKVNWI